MKPLHIKTKRLILLCVALAALLLALAGLLACRHTKGTAQSLDTVSILVDRGTSSRSVNLWRENWPEDGDTSEKEPGDGWFFLPSFAHLNDLRFLYDDRSCTLLFDEQPLASGARIPGIVNGGSYTLSFVDPAGVRTDLPVHFSQSADLPTLFVDTQTGSMENVRADKTHHESGGLKLIAANGKALPSAPLSYIKGHGNQTLSFDKRSYTLKLTQAVSLLGMGADTSWVLLSNVYDDTQLRNKIMYELANDLGLPFSVQSRYCDLYLNGDYAGLYLLCEKVELGENRVNITDLQSQNKALNGDLSAYPVVLSADGKRQYTALPNLPEDSTGGYLVERDYGNKFANDPNWFITDAEESIVLKNPANAAQSQVDYIAGVFQQMENAILAPDGIDPESGRYYTQILDMDSWVKMYLLDEFSKQEGAGVTSSWYYKNSDSVDGLVYSGPAWDYDKCLGRYRRWASPQGITMLSMHDYKSCWFEALYQKQDFYDALVTDYEQQLLPLLEDLLDHGLQDYADSVATAWAMDKIRWGRHGLYNVVSSYDTLEQCVDYLQGWIRARMDFLQSAWLDGDTWYTVTTDGSLSDSPYYFLYARRGECVGELPDSRYEDRGTFLYWVIEGTDTPFGPDTPVNSDLSLEAVWAPADRPETEES